MSAGAQRRTVGYGARGVRVPSILGARAVTAAVIWLIVAVNTAVITWLWLGGGGVSSVHGLGDFLTSVGRITGLIGAFLLLLQVLLLARMRAVESLAGFDRLTVWHRVNGKACLYLVLAHVVAITLGYAMTDRLSVPAEATALLTQYPGMVEATIGTVLLIAVVVTSLVIVRRRLRYESWYLVHLLAYAGIVLGWFHQIPTGNELVLNPSAAAYWTALYVVTLGLLVVFRILQPTFQALWHGFRVAEVWSEGPNVVSLRIVGRRLNRLNVRGGQFFIWRFLTRDRWWEAHPYSLSAAPDGRSLRITVKDLGDFSRRLSGVRPGTRVLTEGPFGVFTAASRTRERVALIAAGIGITPIRAVLEEMVGDIVLVYRVACDEDIVFRDEIESIARTRGIPIHYVVGNRDAPGCAAYMSTEHLIELVPDLAQREVYLCGPPSMMVDVEDNVRRAGVPGRYIHVERFAF